MILIKTKPLDRGPFSCMPAMEHNLKGEDVLCNDVILPWETNYHTVRLYVVGSTFGADAAVWASNEQDALDELCDADKLLQYKAHEENLSEEDMAEMTPLGNCGELHDIQELWILEANLRPVDNYELLCKFAEARGAGEDTLKNYD